MNYAIDTLEISNKLEEMGFSEEKSKGLADILNKISRSWVTTENLKERDLSHFKEHQGIESALEALRSDSKLIREENQKNMMEIRVWICMATITIISAIKFL